MSDEIRDAVSILRLVLDVLVIVLGLRAKRRSKE